MESISQLSLGERIMLVARLAATQHLIDQAEQQRNQPEAEVGGADADCFKEETT